MSTLINQIDQFKIGSRLFAITDHSDVFEVEITENVEIPSGDSPQVLRRLRTKIADIKQIPAYKLHAIEEAHKSYFKTTYLRDGQLEHSNSIYTTKAAAIQKAMQCNNERLHCMKRRFQELTDKQNTLQQELDALNNQSA